VEEPHGEKGLLASGERNAQREGKQQKSLPDRSPGKCCNRHNVRLLLKGVDRVDIHTISYKRGGVNEKGGEIKSKAYVATHTTEILYIKDMPDDRFTSIALHEKRRTRFCSSVVALAMEALTTHPDPTTHPHPLCPNTTILPSTVLILD